MIVLLILGIAAFIIISIAVAIWDADKKFRDEDLGKSKIYLDVVRTKPEEKSKTDTRK